MSFLSPRLSQVFPTTVLGQRGWPAHIEQVGHEPCITSATIISRLYCKVYRRVEGEGSVPKSRWHFLPLLPSAWRGQHCLWGPRTWDSNGSGLIATRVDLTFYYELSLGVGEKNPSGLWGIAGYR